MHHEGRKSPLESSSFSRQRGFFVAKVVDFRGDSWKQPGFKKILENGSMEPKIPCVSEVIVDPNHPLTFGDWIPRVDGNQKSGERTKPPPFGWMDGAFKPGP